MIKKELFGYLKDGREVHSFTIENTYGEYVQLLDYGASVHAIVVRDKFGNPGDVVLGTKDAESLQDFTYEGGTIGRCANRIAYGRYEVAGKKYQLERNLFGHYLHGASGNYAYKFFNEEINEENHTVTFYLRDHGEGGFDCQADVYITFGFSDEGELTLDYDMEAENTTILNPTNHTYFNLSGDKDIRSQVLQIYSDRIVTRGESGLPDGGSVSVKGTPADFTIPRKIADAMASDHSKYFKKANPSYDEFYLLKEDEYQLAAKLNCPETGRSMKVYTDMPCLILFAGGDRAPEAGKKGQIYEGYCAVCLETEFVPNAINCPQYKSPLFYKGDKLISRTVYQFGIEKQ